MVYSYVTHSKQNNKFFFVFENDMEPDVYLKITFVPKDSYMILGTDYLDLHYIKMRDPVLILEHFESFGLTLITEGLEGIFI